MSELGFTKDVEQRKTSELGRQSSQADISSVNGGIAVSPVRHARSVLRSQKEEESAIEGRINYMKSQDQKIRRQVDKARSFAAKKGMTDKARVLHQLLVAQHYQNKLHDIQKQSLQVKALKDSLSKQQGSKALAVLSYKLKQAQDQRQARVENESAIREGLLSEQVEIKRRRQAVR